MEINFNNKRAVVTGAGKNIGRDIAIQLAKCGAQVIAISKSKSDLESLQAEVLSIEVVTLDIGASWKNTQEVISQIGNVDLLVNNAGLGLFKPFIEVTENDYSTIFDVNTKAVFNITQCVVKNMLDRKVHGSIVNISSQVSLAGVMNHTVYSASKSAVDSFTRSLALELGPHNIRVNCVNPTVINTERRKKLWTLEMSKPVIEKIPLKRFGEVREVTDAVLYLLSDKSSMITGHCLPVDGGVVAT